MSIIGSNSIRAGLVRRKLVQERRGAMLVFIAIAGIVLMGFLAMTLDVGAGSRQRRIAQTAADAGAIGGGQEIMRERPLLVNGSAIDEATRNGFTAGGGTTVTVNYPPSGAAGVYAGNTQYVEVTIGRTIPTIFGRIFNIDSLGIQARAVAGVSSFSNNCVYTLDPAAAASLQIDNGADLVTNCGVAVNSNNSCGVELNSSGDLNASPSPVTLRGNYCAGGGASVTPAPQVDAAGVVNPLANLAMPTVGACDFTGTFVVTGTMTLNPGVYCGGISITNASNTANLNPGTYIIAGGGLTVNNSGVINGSGVTIVLTTGTSAFKGLDFGTGCKAKLSAPTSGALKGILVFQDPAAPSTPTSTFACSSTSPPELQGTIYLPNSSITFNGSDANTQIMGAVIANKVIISGKINIVNDITGNSALKYLSLVQ